MIPRAVRPSISVVHRIHSYSMTRRGFGSQARIMRRAALRTRKMTCSRGRPPSGLYHHHTLTMSARTRRATMRGSPRRRRPYPCLVRPEETLLLVLQDEPLERVSRGRRQCARGIESGEVEYAGAGYSLSAMNPSNSRNMSRWAATVAELHRGCALLRPGSDLVRKHSVIVDTSLASSYYRLK